MGGQTDCTHCFLSNLILVISNTAVLWRLVIGKEQAYCFLVELWSAEMTVPTASSQPTSLCVFLHCFGHCNLREVRIWSHVCQMAGIISGAWSGSCYFIAGAKKGFITLEHPALR